MVRLREIPRTATFAWSPGSAPPFIATGTRAGAVDADFSNETCLELWDLDLENARVGSELQPAAKISTDSGFNDIAWAESDDNPRGIIAGALENGSLDLWDAEKLLDGTSDAPLSRTSKHTAPIKTLQFNPRHPNLLATGGAKGELFVSDLNNPDTSYRLGNAAARVDNIECLDWNRKVPHILVTGSSAGFVTVWDVKTKKESLTLNNLGRKAVSSVAWDPEKPTKLVTSIPHESDPSILVWDLRNSNAPERILKGHESGVLSLSWCPQDPSLLLSSGKDNRNICWNPQSGEAYGEFPIVTNWTFQTRWNPHNPNIFATASFDGKIAVQTIQNTGSQASKTDINQTQAANDEEFFSKAQTQPQASTFSLPKAPKWLERPAGASFGFGGKIVSVGLNPGTRSSKITISNFEVDSTIASSTDSFENALNSGDLNNICESRVSETEDENEKGDWKVMGTLISSNPRKELVRFLGFTGEIDEAADSLSKLGLGNAVNGTPGAPSRGAGPKRHKRLTSMFDANPDSEMFLSDLASSKGAKTNSPFRIYTGAETEADRGITRALVLGQFDKALDICLQENRMSDAFMVAQCGGQKCIERAQEAYFLKQSEGPNYVRLLASIVGKDMWDIVHNADLENWKEAIAVICTFASDTEFPDLCETLGDRLEEFSSSQSDKSTRKDASFCYMASSKLEKVISIWIQELQESEREKIQNATDDTGFSIHVRALQDFIEKVTVFRKVAKFQDNERQKPSDWRLSSLYDKYLEYADIVATHGRLDVAEQYLSLLPDNHPEGEVARNRIRLATKKAAPKAAPSHTPSSRATSTPLAGYQPTHQPSMPRGTSQGYNYAPSGVGQPANPYAPTGYQPSQQQPTMAAPSQHMGPPGPQAVPPPPRASNQSPSAASYSQPSNVPAWNDLPDGFARVSTPRRGTPSQASSVISSPFPNQPGSSAVPGPHSAPPQPPNIIPQRTAMPVPPPPKGPAAPPRMMSPQAFQSPERPPSATSNAYTPAAQAHPVGPGMNAPSIPRGASPYNAPPTAPPPTNRYAPNPASQSSAGSAMPPPPPPQQHQQQPPYGQPPAPSPYSSQQYQQGPPQGPPPGPYGPPPVQASQPPPSAPSAGQQESRPSTAQSQKKAPAPPKHPSGDRTHIPADAKPIFEILSGDMQRVKSRAPSSFKAQVNDTERRLNILFDHLNNEELLKPNTVVSMVELAHAIQVRDYETAHAIHLDILTNRTDECGNWMVGVKRLISMSKATP